MSRCDARPSPLPLGKGVTWLWGCPPFPISRLRNIRCVAMGGGSPAERDNNAGLSARRHCLMGHAAPSPMTFGAVSELFREYLPVSPTKGVCC